MIHAIPELLAEVERLEAQVESGNEAFRTVRAEWRRQQDAKDARIAELERELASVREVADPDNETPELSLRDRVMHVGEQAALLVSAIRMCEKRGGRIAALESDLSEATVSLATANERVRALEEEVTAMRLVRLPEWNRKPGCTCFHEEGDSSCNVHGDEMPDGSIAVHCQQRGCLATCDTDILSMSPGWMRVANGWLCEEHRPI